MIEVQQPVVKDNTFEKFEDVLNQLFYEVLWRPIVEILAENKHRTIENAVSGDVEKIIEAMKNKKLFMKRNKESVTFTGEPNSSLSKSLKKEGATYNVNTKSWNVPNTLLAHEITIAHTQIVMAENLMLNKMITALPDMDQIQSLVQENTRWINENMNKLVHEMESDWQTASRNLAVTPKFTEAQRVNIAFEYTNNLERYVVDFCDKQTKELRFLMEESIATGARSSTMIKELQGRFSISKNKATFLAKQETRLLSTQYLHERASVAGCTTFKWSTSHDSRVRDEHKKYSGKTFKVMEVSPRDGDKLPLGGIKTMCVSTDGEVTELPGQPFGCRCRAIYLFDED